MEAVTRTKEIERLLAESEWIGGLAAKLLGDPHRAEDLAQETRMAALQNPPSPRDGSLKPWLATVAKNAARKLYRSDSARLARETERARDRSKETGLSPETLLANLETQELVSRLVRDLPAELSDVIMLSFSEGLSSEEIAKLRNVPAGTVRWRKKKGLETLRKRLDSQFDGDRHAWMSALAPLVSLQGKTKAGAAATGGGILTGILAPWIAMTLTWKIVSIAALACLIAIPFVRGSDAGLDAGTKPEPGPEVAKTKNQPEKESTGSAPELAATEVKTRTPAIAAAPEPEVETHAVTRAKIRAVDTAGLPVAGATVRLFLSSEMQVAHSELLADLNPLELAGLMASMERKTNSQGIAEWETDFLRKEGLVDFHITGPRQAVGETSVLLEVGGTLDLGDVVLQPAGGVAGRVLTPTGPAPKSIFVAVLPVERDEEGNEEAAPTTQSLLGSAHSTRTKFNGTFSCGGIPSGEYRAYVPANPKAEPYRSDIFTVSQGIETKNVEVHSREPLGKQKGKVLTVLGSDGKPLKSAYVTMSHGGFSSSGVVDEKGEWGTPGSVMDKFAGGTLRIVDRSLVHQQKLVEALPDKMLGLEVRLEKAVTLKRTLTISDGAGQPVEAAQVRIMLADVPNLVSVSTSSVDLLLPAAPGQVFDLRVTARGYTPFDSKGLVAQEIPDSWGIALAAQPGIRGTVTALGEPLPKAKIELNWQIEPGKIRTKGNDISRVHFGKADAAASDANGQFQLFQESKGDYVLSVSARGYGNGYALIDDYDPKVGAAKLVIDLQKPGVLEGTVMDHLGNPVPRALVVLDHPYFQAKRKRAGRDGTFRFRKVPAGDWFVRTVPEFDDGFFGQTLQVAEGWNYPSNCTVQPEKTTVADVVLPDPRAQTISGRWTGVSPGNQPLTILIESDDGGLRARDPFVETWESEVEVAPGKEFAIPVEAERNYLIRLKAQNMAGRLYRTVADTDLPLDVHIDMDFANLTIDPASLVASGGTLHQVHLEWQSGEWRFQQFLWPENDPLPKAIAVPAGILTVSYTLKGAEEAPITLETNLAAGEAAVLAL